VPDPLRIGFVTTHAAQDRAAYSGTAFAMRQALLARADVAVIDIDGLSTVLYPLWRAKQAAYWFGFGKRYWMNREPAVLSGYARQVARRVAADEPIDVLLSPGSVPLCHYTGPVPTVFWSDATFDCLVDFYPEATGFSRETIAAGHRMEQAALRNCTLAIYSSDWARQSAADVYRAPAKKLETVPYGANIGRPVRPTRRVSSPPGPVERRGCCSWPTPGSARGAISPWRWPPNWCGVADRWISTSWAAGRPVRCRRSSRCTAFSTRVRRPIAHGWRPCFGRPTRSSCPRVPTACRW
jgi:hypothetical protein